MELAIAIIVLIGGAIQLTNFLLNKYSSHKTEDTPKLIDSFVSITNNIDEDDVEVIIEGAVSQVEDILD